MEKMRVTATSGTTVNMRAEPNANARILQKIPLSTEVECVETSGDWYKIKYQETEGYMMKKFLKANTVSKSDLQRIYNSLAETLALIKKVLE